MCVCPLCSKCFFHTVGSDLDAEVEGGIQLTQPSAQPWSQHMVSAQSPTALHLRRNDFIILLQLWFRHKLRSCSALMLLYRVRHNASASLATRAQLRLMHSVRLCQLKVAVQYPAIVEHHEMMKTQPGVKAHLESGKLHEHYNNNRLG